MSKQRLQQKHQQNLSPQQIQFLSLLQLPIISLEKRIEEELEDNPALEEEEVEEEEIELSHINFSDAQSNDFIQIQIEDKKESLSEYLHQQLITIDVKEEQKFLISYLINSLDNSGFLSRELYAISSDLLINHEMEIREEELLFVLKILGRQSKLDLSFLKIVFYWCN